MAKRQKPSFYAVAKGRKIGIYKSWPECEAQVTGVSGARHKSFHTLKDAKEYMEAQHRDYKNTKLHSIKCEVMDLNDEEYVAERAKEGLLLPGYLNDGEEHLMSSKNGDVKEGQTKSSAKIKAAKQEESEEFMPFDSYDSGLEHSSGSKRYFEAVDDSGHAQSSSSNQKKMKIDVIEVKEARHIDTKADISKRMNGVRTIVCYTDGASSHNGKPNAKAGWGVYWPEGDDPKSDLYNLNESKRLPGHQQTNNRAELMGIIRAVQLCPDPEAQLIIYSDSTYSIKAINEWQVNWRKNKWFTSQKMPVQNKDLIRLLERELRKRSLRPTLLHVKGHSLNLGNREADRLAVEGAQKAAIAPHLWPNYEPSDSEEESNEVASQNAMAAWEKLGFTREKAKLKAGIT